MSEKRVRKPRRNFGEERRKLVMHCRVSIGIMAGFTDQSTEPTSQFFTGQIAALKNVPKLMGEPEDVNV